MKCCQENTQNKDNKDTDTIVLSISKDKILTYTLIVFIIVTVVAGYFVVKNKSKSQKAANASVQGASQTADDMSSHHGGNKKFEGLAPGTVAPDFSLLSTTGKTVSLSDYKGRHVLLFFNEGVMCSPCWQEISRLERFKNDFAGLNAVIIPVSVDDQRTWAPILQEEKITTPILIDSDRKVTSAYKALGTPSSMHEDRAGHTYVHITPDGKIHSSADFPEMNVETKVLMEHIRQVQT